METAVDTSVLLDVLLADPQHAANSETELRKAASDGGLVVCEVVVAEIVPVLGAASVQEFLSDWRIVFRPSSEESAALAGRMFHRYLERGGKRGRVVPDFSDRRARTEARGRFAGPGSRYYRDYFEDLKLVDPSQMN
ncbi:MAG TPA: VapC toxin family PIN domain ribonuclease [Verrucomicrobiae bacterium]|nr:VapC toxin family PIN domain ribonuclease [Verrucomicrobiae bacterium]